MPSVKHGRYVLLVVKIKISTFLLKDLRVDLQGLHVPLAYVPVQ